MIFNLANTFEVGRPVDRIVDANGTEYSYCLEVDTETGYILRQKRGLDGRPQLVDGKVLTEIVKAALPVTVLFKRS